MTAVSSSESASAAPPAERRISRRIAAITESATLAVDAKAKALEAAGKPVIGFGAGEPDFPTPDHIVRGRDRRLPRPGEPPLHARRRAARAARGDRRRRRARDSGLECHASQRARHQRRQAGRLQRLPGDARPGRRGAAARAVLDDLSRGDRARRRRAGPGRRPTSRAASGVSVEQLDAARTPRTKVLLFCSPSNPTGAVYPPERGRGDRPLGRWTHGIWVVTDEIYEHLTYRRRTASRRCPSSCPSSPTRASS